MQRHVVSTRIFSLLIISGLAFGIFGKRLARFGRHYPVVLGFIVHLGAMVIAFVNLPFRSVLEDTTEATYINPSNPYLAIFGSFLLGNIFSM